MKDKVEENKLKKKTKVNKLSIYATSNFLHLF